MKKMTALLLAVLMVLSMAACASKPAEESDLAYIQDKGTLVVGITDFAPMDYQNESGEWIGFDADLAKAFADSLGVKVEFVEIVWDNKVLELDSKTIDCVWNGMTLTSEVTSAMACSNAYCNNAQVVIVPADKAADYQTVESVKDLTFAAAVPKAHLKGRRQRDADAQQNGQVAQHPAEAGHVGKGAAPHNAVDGQRVQTGDEVDKQRIYDQCQQNGNGTHRDLLGHCGALALGNTQQRFTHCGTGLTHALTSFTRLVMRLPTSSLVVLRPSRMPLTLPPQSTTMRSHSSSSTSRSSPT